MFDHFMGLFEKVNMRKKRKDRNFVIYQITNILTGEKYVGITAILGRAIFKSLKVRWQKHLSRAKCETEKEWSLYRNMREHGTDHFEISKLEIVRGKEMAHKRESELIHSGEFILNTHGNKQG